MRHPFILKATTLGILLSASFSTFAQTSAPDSAADWYAEGQAQLIRNLGIANGARVNAEGMAKNVILFVGDGMGVSTVTAARIFEGQSRGLDGEENELFFENAPHIALSKTYNTNQQTPDSAGTMTAMMSGIKTKAGIIGVNQSTVRGDCSSQQGNEVITALELAELAGMSTGVVSTARITHATPAATYSHSMDRNFEDDRDGGNFGDVTGCKDIAAQLIDLPERFSQYPWVDGVEVAMGGGRRSFILREDGADPEDGGQGERLDGRDLTQEWVNNYSNAEYIWNSKQFKNIDTESVDHLLGLFEMSHMEYEADRPLDNGGEPALSEMTAKAIQVLDNNPNGFFLHVESGRIDHAHHATNPYRAMTDTVEFAQAVQTAYEMTDPEETLIIVTADHSHVFTIAGYPTRGNPILGKVITNDSAGEPLTEASLAADGMPYTTLGYTNGYGFNFLETGGDTIYGTEINLTGRADLTSINTEDEGFHSETLVPLSSETHAAEDVAIYASGPGSALINGVVEQNFIYHVMNYAASLENTATEMGWVKE